MFCLIPLKLIFIVLVCTFCNTMSLPIDGKADDFFECEFGTTRQPYNETCANGATNLYPCNPGQLKVAECIGQDGDRSRMCDPCPQKFYQSYYNKCTRCHQCSECGPNEEISELCTEKKDTVCRSIIPPEPVTATSPKPDTTPLSQPPTPSTTTTTISSSPTTQQSVVSTVSPHAVDQTIDTTTAENEKPTPPGPAYQVICFFMALFLVISIILFCICWKQKREIKDLRGGRDENESSTEMPDFIDNDSGTRNPGTVTDAPTEEPITLPSSARNTQAPITDEEEIEEAIGANTNETNAPTADTEDDVLQRLMKPEATAGNNNEGNTTVPTDTETSEDEDGDRKPWTQRALQLVTRLRRNNNKKERKNNQERRKEPTRRRQQLVTMDLEEAHLENVAHRLKLSTLNKLCRELGLTDTEVENYKYEIKSDQITGADLVLKMLVKVRGAQREKFTYRKLDKALRASNNVDIADGMVSECQL